MRWRGAAGMRRGSGLGSGAPGSPLDDGRAGPNNDRVPAGRSRDLGGALDDRAHPEDIVPGQRGYLIVAETERGEDPLSATRVSIRALLALSNEQRQTVPQPGAEIARLRPELARGA